MVRMEKKIVESFEMKRLAYLSIYSIHFKWVTLHHCLPKFILVKIIRPVLLIKDVIILARS